MTDLTGPGSGSTRPPARSWPTAWACSECAPPSGCRGAFARGGRAPRGTSPGPGLAAAPGGCQRPGPAALGHLGPTRDDGALRVGGVDVRDLARDYGTPAYVLDEARRPGSRGGLRTRSRTAFDGRRRLLRRQGVPGTAVARWMVEEGLRLDVCTGGELAVALRAGVPPERIGLHGNNKCDAEIERAVAAGVGRVVVDSLDEIDRVAEAGRRHGRRVQRCCSGSPSASRRTPTSSSRPPTRTRSSASRWPAAQARKAVDRVLEHERGSTCAGCTATSARRSSTRRASRWRRTGSSTCTRSCPDELGVELPEIDLGGGFGIAYTTRRRPDAAGRAGRSGLAEIVVRECAALGVAVPRISVEPGRAIVGAVDLTLYEVGTVKAVELDGGLARTYVSVDGGMSDNIRTALYDADYSCTLASRSSGVPAGAVPGRRQALRERRHRGQGRVPAGRRAPRRPPRRAGTGAYCRSMASNYNHVPRPPVVAVARRAGPGARPPRDRGRPAGPRPRLARLVSPGPLGRWRGPGVRIAECGTLTWRTAARFPSTAHPRASPSKPADRWPLRGPSSRDRSARVQPERRVRRRARRHPAAGRPARLRRRRRAVARLLGEHAAELAARVGAPLELVGIAVRRLERRPAATEVPEELFTTDAEEPGQPGADIVIELMGGIEPARSLILRGDGAGASVVTANKALLATDGPTLYEAAADQRRRPLLRGRASPARSRSCARCASPSPATGTPRPRHRQRHHQLHPRQDGRRPAPASTRRSRRRRPWATPRPTRPPTSRASTPRPRRRSSRAGLPHPGHARPTSTARASPRSPRADVAAARAMGYVVKLLAICERVDLPARVALGQKGSRCGCTRR